MRLSSCVSTLVLASSQALAIALPENAAASVGEIGPAKPGPSSSYSYYGITPTKVTFTSAGTPIVGYHYAPQNTSGSRPAVLVAHGLGGLQTSRIMPFAARFAAEGYHAMTFDYRYWGFSSGQPRNIIDVASQQADYQAAAAFIKTIKDVDANRIVLWGTSLSGGHVLGLAGRHDIDGQVATIAQCPHVNGPYTISFLPPLSLPGLIAAAVDDNTRAGASALGVPVAPLYVPLSAPTGQFGALTQSGAYEGYKFVQPNPPAPGNVFPGRFIAELPFFNPDLIAAKSTLPTFLAIGATDNIVGTVKQQELATEMQADFHSYPTGHFGVYYGADQYNAILGDQVAFLKKYVPV